MKIGAVARVVALSLLLGAVRIALCGPIHEAAEKGNQARVIALLKENPELASSRDKFGNTPLHLAAKHNRVGIAELLLANGADVNARVTEGNNAGETPLTLAVQPYHHKEMLELLLMHGADPNVMLSWGMTPLHHAIEQDVPYDVELLLANGADPNAKGMNWQSPVHTAVLHGRTRILKILLDYGADPNLKDWSGFTPLYYAEKDGYKKAITLLRAHGAIVKVEKGREPASEKPGIYFPH